MSEPAAVQLDRTLTQWLETQHQALTNDLTAVLDLETGLAEAMTPARRAALGADLPTIRWMHCARVRWPGRDDPGAMTELRNAGSGGTCVPELSLTCRQIASNCYSGRHRGDRSCPRVAPRPGDSAEQHDRVADRARMLNRPR